MPFPIWPVATAGAGLVAYLLLRSKDQSGVATSIPKPPSLPGTTPVVVKGQTFPACSDVVKLMTTPPSNRTPEQQKIVDFAAAVLKRVEAGTASPEEQAWVKQCRATASTEGGVPNPTVSGRSSGFQDPHNDPAYLEAQRALAAANAVYTAAGTPTYNRETAGVGTNTDTRLAIYKVTMTSVFDTVKLYSQAGVYASQGLDEYAGALLLRMDQVWSAKVSGVPPEGLPLTYTDYPLTNPAFCRERLFQDANIAAIAAVAEASATGLAPALIQTPISGAEQSPALAMYQLQSQALRLTQ